MGLVSSYMASVPVTGDAYGDVSRSVLYVADKLSSPPYSYLAIGRAIQTGTGSWTGAPIFGKVQFTLRKVGGAPFDADKAGADLRAVSNSVGLKLALAGDWTVQLSEVVNPGYIASNVGQELANQLAERQRRRQECEAKGGWFCALNAVGIPDWVVYLAGGTLALVALSKVAEIVKVFK